MEAMADGETLTFSAIAWKRNSHKNVMLDVRYRIENTTYVDRGRKMRRNMLAPKKNSMMR